MGVYFCLQVDGPITGVRAYEWGGGGLVSGSLRSSEISVSALTFLYRLRSFRQSSVRFCSFCVRVGSVP